MPTTRELLLGVLAGDGLAARAGLTAPAAPLAARTPHLHSPALAPAPLPCHSYCTLQRLTEADVTDFILDQGVLLHEAYLADRAAIPPGALRLRLLRWSPARLQTLLPHVLLTPSAAPCCRPARGGGLC